MHSSDDKVTFPVLQKIVSGGQTGADQGALDAAISLGIDHGGWLPKGRKTENGALPSNYNLKEMDSAHYAKRTLQNVIDSDGTLIISHGPLTGGRFGTHPYAGATASASLFTH
ncbi:putative molybdenum carrier protein [Desulfococcaceae bacterium HSG9]|nr:putative molybdenum carrier protein [Desulfococcaceae bacterium HSG9]